MISSSIGLNFLKSAREIFYPPSVEYMSKLEMPVNEGHFLTDSSLQVVLCQKPSVLSLLHEYYFLSIPTLVNAAYFIRVKVHDTTLEVAGRNEFKMFTGKRCGGSGLEREEHLSLPS